MELDIRGHDVHLNDSLRDHVERRLEFALGQFDNRISHVSVTLLDSNGPKNGSDKRCTILVQLRGGSTIKVEDDDDDFESVVSRAADRVGHAVTRQVERRRDRKAKPGTAEESPVAEEESAVGEEE